MESILRILCTTLVYTSSIEQIQRQTLWLMMSKTSLILQIRSTYSYIQSSLKLLLLSVRHTLYDCIMSFKIIYTKVDTPKLMAAVNFQVALQQELPSFFPTFCTSSLFTELSYDLVSKDCQQHLQWYRFSLIIYHWNKAIFQQSSERFIYYLSKNSLSFSLSQVFSLSLFLSHIIKFQLYQ